jgi:hypothetical protein
MNSDGREPAALLFTLENRVFSSQKANYMTHEEFTRMTGDPAEQGETASVHKSRDQDKGKGAIEQDHEDQGGNTGMQGQLGHRDEDAELKDADSDLPG